MAVAAWGDTPAVRESGANRTTRRVLRVHIMRLNRRLTRHNEPYVVSPLKGRGYVMTTRQDAPKPEHHAVYIADERKQLLQRFEKIRAAHPEMGAKAICRKIGLKSSTYYAWLKRHPET